MTESITLKITIESRQFTPSEVLSFVDSHLNGDISNQFIVEEVTREVEDDE